MRPEKISGIIWPLAFCLASLFFSPALPAQTYHTRHFSVRDGLPSACIRCIFKDSQGLMWIGTDAALCTFDGKSFEIIRTPEGNSLDQI